MGSNKIITLMDNGIEFDSVEVICAFEVPGLLGKYIIYTKNEKDKDGNTIIYSGKLKFVGDKQYISNIEEGIEWEELKSIMRAISRYSLEGENYV